MITPAQVRRAEYIVDTSDIVAKMEVGIQRDSRGRKKPEHTLRLLIIGLYLAISERGSATITDVHKLLTVDLPVNEQIRLKIRKRDGGRVVVATRKQLYYQAARLHALEYGVGSAPDLDAEERQRRHHVIISMSNGMMDVFDLGWKSMVFAMDATGIWSWAKGKRKTAPVVVIDAEKDDLEPEIIEALRNARETGEMSDDVMKSNDASRAQADKDEEDAAKPGVDGTTSEVPPAPKVGVKASHDPDAGWGVKTSKSGKHEVFFGYHEHTLVQVPETDTEKDTEPRLIRRLELTPAAEDVVDVSLRLLDSMPTRVRDLNVDLHYSYKRIDRWLRQLTRRGIRQHHDLRSDEQGFTEYEGLRWAAGWAHCPKTPDGLGVIPRPSAFAPLADKEAFSTEIAKRQAYAMRIVNQPDENGAVRIECPAWTTAGCALVAGSVETAVALGLPIIENPPNEERDGEPLPRCCAQKTVKVTPPPSVQKLAQPLYWGSKRHSKMFNKRTYVEGSYGNRKNASTENLRRGLFRSTGLVWVNLIVTLSAASYNTRMLRNWHERTGLGDPNHPLLTVDEEMFGFVFLSAAERDAIDDDLLGKVA